MPWFTNPVLTCRVLNRIANRYSRAPLQDLKTTMDIATQSIWSKQEHYYNSKASISSESSEFNSGH
jgi:hypothetical protein